MSRPVILSRSLPHSLLAALLFGGLSAFAQSEPLAPVSINTLVQQVLASNPEANFYRAEIAAAKGEARTAATFRNPELTAEFGTKRVRPGAGGPATDGPAWSVSVQQTFEFPGRMALRKAIAGQQIELAEIGFAQFQAALGARTRTLAYDIFVEQQRADTAREVADRMQGLQDVLVQRDPAGLNPRLEARILEANALTLQRRASQAEVAKRNALIELNQLRGVPLESSFHVASLDLQFRAAPPLEELLGAARSNAFEMRMRQAELAQQGFKVSLARSERYGDITVAPFYSEEKAGDKERQVGVGVTVPLPLWTHKSGTTDTARARLLQAETSVLMTQKQIDRQVVTSASEYTVKLEEIGRWRPGAAEEFRDAAAEADRHYRLGAVPLSTYVELQKQYLEATDALLETRREAFNASQQIELLTGIGLYTEGGATLAPEAKP